MHNSNSTGMAASSSLFGFVLSVCFVLFIGIGLAGNTVHGRAVKNHKQSSDSVPSDLEDTQESDIYNNDLGGQTNYSSIIDWYSDNNSTDMNHYNFSFSQDNSTVASDFPFSNETQYNQSGLQFSNYTQYNSNGNVLTEQNTTLSNGSLYNNLTSTQNHTYNSSIPFDREEFFNNTSLNNGTLGIPNGTDASGFGEGISSTQTATTTVQTTTVPSTTVPSTTVQTTTIATTTVPSTTVPSTTVTTTMPETTTTATTTQMPSTTEASTTSAPLFPATQVSSTTASLDMTDLFPDQPDTMYPPDLDMFFPSSTGSTTTDFPGETASTTIAYINGLQNYLNIRDKHYVTSVLIPVAAGILGALFIVCVAYSVKTCGKKRQYTQMHSTHSDQDSHRQRNKANSRTPQDMQRPTTDRMMLLADSSDEEFAPW